MMAILMKAALEERVGASSSGIIDGTFLFLSSRTIPFPLESPLEPLLKKQAL